MGESNSDLYELHWNNHSHVLKGTFDCFRGSNELIDVTLSCSGGRKLGAHKIVLSACSEYFFDLFKENPCQHPIVIMNEIGYEPMCNILDFMYTGEINIKIEHLDTFLKIAESLQIKGLTIQNDTNQNDQPVIKKKRLNQNKTNGNETAPKRNKTTENDTKKTKLEIVENEVEDQKGGIINLDLLNDDSVEYATLDVNDQTEYNDISNLSPKYQDADVGNKMASYPCPHCNKIFNHYISLKLHLPSHSGDTSCHLCGAVLGRKYDLKVHMRRKHNVNIDGSPAFINQSMYPTGNNETMTKL